MDSEAKFTPWGAAPDVHGHDFWIVRECKFSTEIAMVHANPVSGSAEDHARLIAAAPDLYEAATIARSGIVEILTHVLGGSSVEDLKPVTQRICAALDAALAKATGAQT